MHIDIAGSTWNEIANNVLSLLIHQRDQSLSLKKYRNMRYTRKSAGYAGENFQICQWWYRNMYGFSLLSIKKPIRRKCCVLPIQIKTEHTDVQLIYFLDLQTFRYFSCDSNMFYWSLFMWLFYSMQAEGGSSADSLSTSMTGEFILSSASSSLSLQWKL